MLTYSLGFHKMATTYNGGDAPVVTHLTTSPPVRCFEKRLSEQEALLFLGLSPQKPPIFLFTVIC
jgi:hypothetical protein